MASTAKPGISIRKGLKKVVKTTGKGGGKVKGASKGVANHGLR